MYLLATTQIFKKRIQNCDQNTRTGRQIRCVEHFKGRCHQKKHATQVDRTAKMEIL